MRAVVLLLAAGCNPVFGLERTELLPPIDAQYFDAPADAAPTCPATGSEPMFQAGFNQLADQDCLFYIPSGEWGMAMAQCRNVIMQGPVNGTLSAATLTPSGRLDRPRLSSDGQMLFVENATTLKVDIYARNPDDTWTATGQTIADASYREISNASRGPARRAIQADFNGSVYLLNELVEQPDGTWMIVDTYPDSLIGVGAVFYPSLSGDALRLTFSGATGPSTRAIFVAQRDSVSARFSTAVALTTVPEEATSPFMTDDCGLLYFSALGQIFYQKQL